MSDLELHESLVEGVQLTFGAWLYNRASFLRSNNELPQKHFYLFNRATKCYIAHIVFSLDGKLALSPFKAPFGGIEMSSEVSAQSLKWFLDQIEKALFDLGVEELRIHQAPENYQSNELLTAFFLESEYDIIQERIYHGIDIDEVSLSEKMVDMQKRRLRKCENAGFIFKKYKKSELAAAFKQIDRWRTAADKGLSMTWADLHDSSKRNPKAYHAFGIENEHGLMIAGSIVVSVNTRVLYNFFPASYDAYNNYSPMVMLTSKIYDWGKVNGYKHLDLGTSYIHKNVNTGLKQFKERLGGKEYSAWSWRKRLT